MKNLTAYWKRSRLAVSRHCIFLVGGRRSGKTTLARELSKSTGVTSGLRPYPTEPIYMHSIHGKAHIFTGGGRVGFCLSGMIGSNLKDILSGKIEL